MQPSFEFLSQSIVAALLEYYHVDGPPVPVRQFLLSPHPDLVEDVSLIEGEGITFCDALWVRLVRGQGVVFVNSALPEPQRRYGMACALFSALCSSRGGRAAGYSSGWNGSIYERAAVFARWLLIPAELLPSDWPQLSAEELADLFLIPRAVAEARRQELLGVSETAEVTAS